MAASSAIGEEFTLSGPFHDKTPGRWEISYPHDMGQGKSMWVAITYGLEGEEFHGVGPNRVGAMAAALEEAITAGYCVGVLGRNEGRG